MAWIGTGFVMTSVSERKAEAGRLSGGRGRGAFILYE